MFTYTILHTQTVQIEQKFHHPNLKLALKMLSLLNQVYMVQIAGLEPALFRLSVECINQLCYICKNFQNDFLFWVTGGQS